MSGTSLAAVSASRSTMSPHRPPGARSASSKMQTTGPSLPISRSRRGSSWVGPSRSRREKIARTSSTDASLLESTWPSSAAYGVSPSASVTTFWMTAVTRSGAGPPSLHGT